MTGLETDIRNYYDDFILKKNTTVDKTKASIFSCLQSLYNVDLLTVVTTLKPAKVIAVAIGEEIIAKQYTYAEILESCNEIANSDTSYTFAFIFDK
jgi:hypothetical protein